MAGRPPGSAGRLQKSLIALALGLCALAFLAPSGDASRTSGAHPSSRPPLGGLDIVGVGPPEQLREADRAIAEARTLHAKVVRAEVPWSALEPRGPNQLEPLALALSMRTGCPVKLVMSRAEVLRASGPTSGSTIKVKLGAGKDGKIKAAHVWLAYEAGGFPGSPVAAGAMTVLAPYALDILQIDGYDVVVNKPKTAAYRAPGATNAAFAVETVLDEIAEKCGIDPIDLRIKNGVKQGSAPMDATARVVTGSELDAIRERVIAKYGFATKLTKAVGTLTGIVRGKRIPYGDRGVVIEPTPTG